MSVRGLCLLLLTTAACGRFEFAAQPDARPDGQGDAPLLDLGPNATYSDLIRASAPRVYFRMDDPDATQALDSSGHGVVGNYGTFAGGTLQFGLAGALTRESSKAVRMDADGNLGPTDSAGMELDPTVINWAGDFTVELFWMNHRTTVSGFSHAMFVCEHYLMNGFRVGWSSSLQLHMWTDEAGSTGVLVATSPMDLNVFHHIALVHEGTRFTLYQDGVAVGSDTTPYIPVDSQAECGIGSIHGMPSYSTYDEVALYDRALSQGELTAHLAAR